MLTIEFAVAAMYMDSVACRGVVVEGTKDEERRSSTMHCLGGQHNHVVSSEFQRTCKFSDAVEY